MSGRMRHFPTLVYAGIGVLLGISSLCLAEVIPLPDATNCPAPPPVRSYRAEGTLGPAPILNSGLSLRWVPTAELSEDYPVQFWTDGAHPNMFSSPVVELVVGHPASFEIDVYETGGRLIDSFWYADVDTGAYFFPIPRQLWRGPQGTTLVLRYNGSTVDSVVYADTIGR